MNLPEQHITEKAAAVLTAVNSEIRKSVIGQDDMVRKILCCLICGQHALIEGVPGLAKTLTVSSLARSLSLDFKRIQFTPDLLPSDLLGTMIYHPATGEFSPHKGPLFSQIILADEINRAPAKVQSALLEAMQERQITLGDETHILPDPFLVLATQNPVDQEGTYPLPEAQTDRFMMKITLTYPAEHEELNIIRQYARPAAAPSDGAVSSTVAGAAEIKILREALNAVHVEPVLEEYILALVRESRAESPYIQFGASPRAGLSLYQAAAAWALQEGRAYMIPEDITAVFPDVMRHRLILSYRAETENITAERLIQDILDNVRYS